MEDKAYKEGDFRSAAAAAGYWDKKLYAWCKVYEPKEETLEISVPFDEDLVPSIENLAQEIFSQKIWPIFEQKFVPDDYFPLNKNETDYLSQRFHWLMHTTTKEAVEKSLQTLLKHN